MADLKSTIPEEFSAPTALPKSEEEAQKWQEANAAWWETHPMRYDWSEPALTKSSPGNFTRKRIMSPIQ